MDAEPKPPRGWNSRQEIAAAFLAAGRTHRGAAKEAGVAKRTITNWLQLPGYRERVAELRGDIIGRAGGVLASGLTKAARKLIKLIDDEDPKVAARASTDVLALGLRFRESVDLADEVSRLRELAEGAD